MQLQKLYMIFIFLALPFVGLSQSARVQKMKEALTNYTQEDSVRFHMLDDLAWELRRTDPDEAMQYARAALQLAEDIEYRKGEGISHNMMGILYNNLGDYERALEEYEQALAIRREIEDLRAVGNTLDNMGTVYQRKGEYDEAVNYQIEALKIREAIGDSAGMASGYNNIGVIYKKQQDFEKALEYYEKALSIEQSLSDSISIANNFNNIGSVYFLQRDFQKAQEFYEAALAIRDALGDKRGKASSYNNLGSLMMKKELVPEALNYYLKAVAISESIGDKNNTSISYNRIGELLKEMNSPEQSIRYFQRSLRIAKEIGALEIQKADNQELAEIYELLATQASSSSEKASYLAEALAYQKAYFTTHDSLFSKEKVQQIAELESKYEIERHASENEKLKRERAIERAENEKKQAISATLVRAALVISLLMGLLIFVLWRSNRQRKRVNAELISQQEEISAINDTLTRANEEIRKKNDDITASINYAKRIQNAMFPDIKILDNTPITDHFILLKPRNIVSGDFYWFFKSETHLFLAAVDCTGHGVPGAIMSMIGFEQLTEIVREHQQHNPSLILKELQEGVRAILKQDETNISDGMDLAICAIELANGKIEFAGAKRPIILITEEEGSPKMHTIKGDRLSIGGMKLEENFTTHTFIPNRYCYIYMFSDGYQDQFGGEENKKFMFKPLRNLLFESHHIPMEEQKILLEGTLDNWRGSKDQIDDILVMGFRLEVPQTADRVSAESTNL